MGYAGACRASGFPQKTAASGCFLHAVFVYVLAGALYDYIPAGKRSIPGITKAGAGSYAGDNVGMRSDTYLFGYA